MNIDEVPFDCFKTHCCVTGTPEEIDQAFSDYITRYPYMQYATRIKERTDDTAVFVRWTRKEDCIAACIHKAVAKPIEGNKEKGQHNTVFQTNHTMRV